MTITNITDARKNLYKLVNEVSDSHEPVFIKGKHHNAVLLSEEDWRAIQETLVLESIPGLAESVQEGLATPVEECDEDIEW